MSSSGELAWTLRTSSIRQDIDWFTLKRSVVNGKVLLKKKVHKWVNYESMLKKCLVGRLRSGGDPSQGKGKRPEKKSSQVPSVIAAALPSPAALSIVTGVTTDWMQSPARVTIVFYTRQKGLEAKNVSTALEGSSSLRVRITNA